MHINIVTLNIPLPANYGGVIDIFYKIKAFYEAGIKIHLHCFEYNRERNDELNLYCESVNYYRRNLKLINNLSLKPYIVTSRKSKLLTRELIKNNYPILYEGIHTTSNINCKELNNRIKIVRTHNIEHDYYQNLYKTEIYFNKKLYFFIEALKLKYFETRQLSNANLIAAISPNDFNYFSMKFKKTVLLPGFHQNELVNINLSDGKYVLYHGNLSVNENIEAALYLINSVFTDLDIPFYIAGSNPDQQICKAAEINKLIKIIANPSENEMNDLISNAQIIVLPTFQATGIKLKLLQSLFIGKHCIVNNFMVENTNLEKLCIISNSSQDFIVNIQKYFLLKFSNKMVEERKIVLDKYYSNRKNISMFIEVLEKLNYSTKNQ
jgi:hypothetical protein